MSETGKYDANKYYRANTNIGEFFDYGDKPFYAVRNVEFHDEDGNVNELGGKVTFIAPELFEHQVFRVYVGLCASCRTLLVASKTWVNPLLPAPTEVIIDHSTRIDQLGKGDTDNLYLIVVTKNELGENDQNNLVDEIFSPKDGAGNIDVAQQVIGNVIQFTETGFDCRYWQPCDKSCMLKPKDWSLYDELPWQACAVDGNKHNVQTECHRMRCPVKFFSVWPKHSNFVPNVERFSQSITRKGVVTVYHDKEPLYLYQEYYNRFSQSSVKVTVFKDDSAGANCKDEGDADMCKDKVQSGICLTSSKVLEDCRLSCGACQSHWGTVTVPAHHDDPAQHASQSDGSEWSGKHDAYIGEFTVLDVFSTDTIYVRSICILRDDIAVANNSFLVKVPRINVDDPLITGNVIEYEVRSLVNRYGWKHDLTLFYVVDTIPPEIEDIQYDPMAVNHTLFERRNTPYLKHESIIPLPSSLFSEDHSFGLLRVDISSWNAKCLEEGQNAGTGTLEEWLYSDRPELCFTNTIPITFWVVIMAMEQSLALSQSEAIRPCHRMFVNYDSYDIWLTQSFGPMPFNLAEHSFYSVFDENPHNELGELHIEIGCSTSLRWFVQIGIGGEWTEWVVSGQSKLTGSGRDVFDYFDAELGAVREQEVRRYWVRVADPDVFVVPKDERVPMVLNVSVRVEFDEMIDGKMTTLSDTMRLTATRVPDYETIQPLVMKPRHGEVVPSGLFVSYLIPEDALEGSVKLRILPRASSKYPTDDVDIREIPFRKGSFAEKSGMKHTVKMCPKLGDPHCLEVSDGMGLGQIVESIYPAVDLLDFSLYDLIVQYNDRWGNPHNFRRVNHLMVVRDWTEDLVVLRYTA